MDDSLKLSRYLIKTYGKEHFEEIKQLSKNKLCIIISNRRVANVCMKITYWNGNDLIAFISNHLMVRQGMIKGLPLYIDENEIFDPSVAEFSSIHGPIKITHLRGFIKRAFNKEKQQIETNPTTTVQITE